jgi:glyoxylate reductase
MSLILMVTRRLGEGERVIRAQEPWHWGMFYMLGMGLQGRQLGIVGMGAIGQAVARRGKGFGLEIIYFNRNRVAPEIESSLSAQFVSFDELVRRSDFVSLHAPLNEQSRHLFNQQTFQSMKSTAVLVNTGRGALIDEVELVAALQQGRIAAAGLDVYEFEPKITEGLVSLDNVVLAPHLGSASTSARGDMVRLCCENVIAVLAGKPALTPVHA